MEKGKGKYLMNMSLLLAIFAGLFYFMIKDHVNEVMGILDAIRQEHDALDFNIEDLQKKLANTENLDTVKEVLSKLG